MFSRRLILASPAFIAACAADPTGDADPEMTALLRSLTSLGPLPIEALSPADARRQPTLTDAVKAQLRGAGRPVTPRAIPRVMETSVPITPQPLQARLYTPAPTADGGRPPLIVYFHGGGWVIADLDTYDASARALAAEAGAVVLSVRYRQGPEHRFPAAHDDAVNAWRWAVANAASLGADPRRAAVVGESAGGNLAMNVAIAARGTAAVPVAVGAIYPVAGASIQTASYNRYAAAKPLNRPMMQWFLRHYLQGNIGVDDPRLDIYNRANLAGLPSTLIINAQIDPLLDDGAMLEAAMRRQGSPVRRSVYPGVTHEFFGADAVLTKSRAAQQEMGQFLRTAFANVPAMEEPPPRRRRS